MSICFRVFGKHDGPICSGKIKRKFAGRLVKRSLGGSALGWWMPVFLVAIWRLTTQCFGSEQFTSNVPAEPTCQSTLQCLSNFLSYSVRTWKFVENHHNSLAGKLGRAEPGNLGTILSAEQLSFATPLSLVAVHAIPCPLVHLQLSKKVSTGALFRRKHSGMSGTGVAGNSILHGKEGQAFNIFQSISRIMPSKCSQNWMSLR